MDAVENTSIFFETRFYFIFKYERDFLAAKYACVFISRA
jgi:hypothetical protein